MADYYVSSLAGGTGNGSSGNPWTLAEAEAEINTPTVWVDGDTMWIKADGTYTTSGIVITNHGGVTNTSKFKGYTDTIGDNGKATIQRSGGASYLLQFNSNYWTVWNLILDGQSSGTTNLYLKHYSSGYRIESKLAGTNGFEVTSSQIGTHIINCYSHNNGARGGLRGTYENCLSETNGGNGINTDKGSIINCISRNNVLYQIVCWGDAIMNCIADSVDANASGIFGASSTNIMNCIIVNVPSPAYGILASGIPGAFNCNFYNVDLKFSASDYYQSYTEVDPQFNNPSGFDYTRNGTNLNDLGFSEVGMVSGVDYNIDVGIDQKATPDYPAVTDVRSGVSYGGNTGTLDLPAEADVQSGVQFDNTTKTGTFVSPSQNDVQNGVTYGNSSEFTGNFQAPSENDVQSGVGFGSNGSEYTGNFGVPNIGDVEKGVQFGANGSEYTGTFKEPGIANVRQGTQYGAGDTEFTGTLDLPSENDVQDSVTFDGANKTGNFTVPSVGDVQSGIQYGANGIEYTGTFIVPAEGDVEKGVQYGASGTEFIGTFTASFTLINKIVKKYGKVGVDEFSDIFKVEAEIIKVFVTKETETDPYDHMVTKTTFNPIPVKAIVTDLIASQIMWKLPGIETEKAKELIIEKRHRALMELSDKIEIDSEDYYGWRNNERVMQIREEGKYLRIYVYIKKDS